MEREVEGQVEREGEEGVAICANLKSRCSVEARSKRDCADSRQLEAKTKSLVGGKPQPEEETAEEDKSIHTVTAAEEFNYYPNVIINIINIILLV